MTPTGTAPRPGARAAATPAGSSRAGSTTSSPAAGRFVPGTVLAQRYRIVGLVGKGGMGEVYRADDLKLGQPIALKFLPASLESDADRLERFFGEVRTARQITHPNVCRVHDVDEVDGHHFLSMEYVDGEDLASLLRRIGRLPEAKALEIARQLCAGVAAAHDRSVLHRDLKPENVMIDGRGHVRITDFGLAGLADTISGPEVRSGTPAYMAPEQLAGASVTARSDIYALGLILYEVLTGKKAFEGRTFAELLRRHQESTPAPPSSFVADVDPALERVILRCLEEDPARRPTSARAVAAALPGSDPLAAALAAGETPSPEMVAAAGDPGSLRPRVAWACLASLVVALGLCLAVWPGRSLLSHVPLDKPPAALEDRAREILKAAGYGGKPADEARSLEIDNDFLKYVEGRERSAGRWPLVAAGPTFQFWYRQSPRPMVSQRFFGTITSSHPPPLQSGMTGVRLDSRGRLLELYAIPPQVEEGSAAATEADWPPLLAAAGLDRGRLAAAEPRWTPPSFCDARVAWEGDHAEIPGARLRVEAASYRGRPVYFQVIGPWTRPDRMQPFELAPGLKAANIIGLGLFLSVLIASSLLARHNTRLGRADRKGAFRIARYTFGTMLAIWALSAHHVPAFEEELVLLLRALGVALLFGATLWVLYVALEPYVRRHWPARIVAWSRLLAGQIRDPLVGRDTLLGATFGAAIMALAGFMRFLLERLDAPVSLLVSASDPPIDFRDVASGLLAAQLDAVLVGMFLLLLLLLLRGLLRREWLAVVVFAGISGIQNALRSGAKGAPAALVFALGFALSVILLGVLVRFGLLAASGTLLFEQLLWLFPLTLDASSWYAGWTLVFVLVTLGLGVWGFRTALAGQPVFGGEWLKD